MDFDNGSEFINYDMVSWAAERDIYFTRSRPYKKNDQATIESKNNHVVRKYAYYWRYDNPEVLALLGQLWPLVNDRMNYFTPTKNPSVSPPPVRADAAECLIHPELPWIASSTVASSAPRDRNSCFIGEPNSTLPTLVEKSTGSNRNSPASPEHPPCD